jgi:hypothetical protein
MCCDIELWEQHERRRCRLSETACDRGLPIEDLSALVAT